MDTKELNRLVKLKHKFKNSSNVKKLAKTIKEIGDFYFENEKYEDAIQEYNEQIDICIDLKSHDPEEKLNYSVAHRMIGECFINIGNYDDALQHLNKYLTGALELRNLHEEQRAYATLGRLYFCQAENCRPDEKKIILEKAIEAFSKSILCCEKLRKAKALPSKELASMKARLLLNFGLIHAYTNFEQACKWINSAIDLCMENGLKEELHMSFMALGSTNEKHSKFEEALDYFDKAASTHMQAHKIDGTLAKVELCLKLGKWNDARQLLVKLYKMKEKTSLQSRNVELFLKIVIYILKQENELEFSDKSDADKIVIYDKLGDSAVRVNNLNAAIDYYEKMVKCCERTNSKQLSDALVSLARTLQDVGRYEEAILYAKKEMDLQTDHSNICTSALFLASLQIAACANENDIRESFNIAIDSARRSQNPSLERKTLKEQLIYYENTQQLKELSYIREKLDLMKDIESSNDEDSDEKEFEVDVDLDEISDLEDETPRTTEKRVARKRPGKKIKKNEKGETPLHVACIHNNIANVKKLLSEGHPVNLYDNAGFAPLHEAANFGYTDIAELLIEYGANVNDPGGPLLQGMTPLHDASTNGAFEMIQLLIKHGADPNLEYKDGLTAYDCLKEWRERVDSQLTDSQEEEYQKVLLLMKGLMKAKPNSSKQQNKQKKVVPKMFKYSPLSDSEDEIEKIDEEFDNEVKKSTKLSAAEDYRKTIESMKHRPPTIVPTAKSKVPEEEKAPLLDSEEVLVGEWMEDDLGINRKSSRRDGFEYKRKSSESGNENAERAKKPKCFDDESVYSEMDTGHFHKHNSMEQVLQNLVDDDSDTENQPVKNVIRKVPKFKQLSLDKSGIKRSGDRRNAQSPIFESNDSNYVNMNYVQQKEAQLKIFLKDHVYRVHVSFPRDNSKTVEAILNDVKEQFKSETGCLADLSLSPLNNSSIIISNSKLNVFTKDGQITDFNCEIVQLTVLPITQRYSTFCQTYKIDLSDSAVRSLQIAEKQSSFTFNANETSEDQILPLMKTIAYEPNLHTLCLSGVSLYNLGQLLDSTLSHHTNLTSLILENCDITHNCLLKLKELPRRLKIIKLSNNPLGVKSTDKLYSLLSPLKELNTLELRGCDLTFLQFNSLSETLVNLDISGNFIDQISVENLTQRFFINLNVSYSVQDYSELSISRSIINDSRLLSFTLETLDFSCCKLRDSDVDLILRSTPNLRKIELNNNKELTYISVQKLLAFKPTLSYIGVVGCQQIVEMPDAGLKIENPQTCTMLISMDHSVIHYWESLWEGYCVGTIVAKHIIKFEPS